MNFATLSKQPQQSRMMFAGTRYLLTSAFLLWLIYDSYINGNYDFAKTVLTLGIGGIVIGSIATYYFQHNDT